MKPRQKKSRTYYYFWGVATLSVVLGQWYVGNGFRRMAESNDGISADINLLIENIQFQIPTQEFYDDPSTQFLIHDNLDKEIPTPEEVSGAPDRQVFCGVLFERRS